MTTKSYSNMTDKNFEAWMAGFVPDGPTGDDLDELARGLLYSESSSNQVADIFDILNLASFTPSSDCDPVSWKGVSVEWFLEVFMESREAKIFVEHECPMWFVRNHCIPQMMLKLTSGTSCCLVECVEAHESNSTLVKSATVFISYTGSYKLHHFAELCKELEGHYMWSDVFCVDQIAWKLQDNDFKENFMYHLQTKIGVIHLTVLLLDKWDHLMSAVGKIWVLWEIFATVEHSANFEILLSDTERSRFYDRLGSTESIHKIFKALADVDARNAKARSEEDTTRILRIMETDKGVSRVNSQVIKRLRDWLLETASPLFEDDSVSSVGDESLQNELDDLKLKHNTAYLYEAMGDVAEAEKLQREVVQGFRERLGDDNAMTETSKNALAGYLRQQKKLEEAQTLQQQLYNARCGKLGNSALDSLVSANNLANVLMDQLKFGEAKEIYRSALQHMPPFHGTEDSSIFELRQSLLSNLGSAHLDLGEVSASETRFEEALRLLRSKLGNRHPHTIRALGRLASVSFCRGKLQASEMLYRECLQLQIEVLGEANHQTLDTMHGLAGVLLEMSRNAVNTDSIKEAENLFRAVVDGRRKCLGVDSQDTLKSQVKLGVALAFQERYAEAELFLSEAHVTQCRILGEGHRDTLDCGMEVLQLYCLTGQDKEAMVLWKEVQDGYEALHGTAWATEKMRKRFAGTGVYREFCTSR